MFCGHCVRQCSGRAHCALVRALLRAARYEAEHRDCLSIELQFIQQLLDNYRSTHDRAPEAERELTDWLDAHRVCDLNDE